MKEILKYPALITASTLLLVGCQPEGNSDTSPPEIVQVHTFAMVFEDPGDDTEADMRLSMMAEVDDEDGFEDLETLKITFPNDGTITRTIEGSYAQSRNGHDYVRIRFNMSNYDDGSGNRQFKMTGYKFKVTDASGLSDELAFDVSAPEDEYVPMGAILVHPDDYSDDGGSGGDYIPAMDQPTVTSATFDATEDVLTVEADMTDDRASEMELFFYIDDEWVASVLEKDSAKLNIPGTTSYEIRQDDLNLEDDSTQIEDLESVDVGFYDTGVSEEPFDGLSQAGSYSGMVDISTE